MLRNVCELMLTVDVRSVGHRPVQAFEVVVEPATGSNVADSAIPFTVRKLLLPAGHIMVLYVLMQIRSAAMAIPVMTVARLRNGVGGVVCDDFSLQTLECKQLGGMIGQLTNGVIKLDLHTQCMCLNTKIELIVLLRILYLLCVVVHELNRDRDKRIVDL